MGDLRDMYGRGGAMTPPKAKTSYQKAAASRTGLKKKVKKVKRKVSKGSK